MNSIIRFMKPNMVNNILPLVASRTLFTSSPLYLKEIRETQNGKVLEIEGEIVESPRAKHLVPLEAPASEKCTLCQLNLDVKHTDVLILHQFLRSDGCMLPRRITGLCKKQQKRVSILVAMSQKAGLMPTLVPPKSKKDLSRRKDWRRNNKYFDESTINIKMRY